MVALKKTPEQVLTETRRLVASGWCQGHYEQDASGTAFFTIGNFAAVKHCISGALLVVAGDDYEAESGASEILSLALAKMHPDDPNCDNYVIWNDASERTQEEVLALLDFALAQ